MLQVYSNADAHHHWPQMRFAKNCFSAGLPLYHATNHSSWYAHADNERREQRELCRRVEIVDRHVMLEPEPLAQRDDDREDHSDAREDRASDEVRREHRCVPTRHVSDMAKSNDTTE